jgi:tripartite ATP-independent transporter DctM subunit
MNFLIAHLDMLMFPAAIILLLRGFPVAFTLAGVGMIFALVGAWTHTGFFAGGDLGFLRPIFGRLFGLMDESNEVLVAVPIFVFMGVVLERSGVAGELLSSMAQLFGRWPGGLGISVVFVGMLLAASTGVVGATVVTMGLISLPTMLAHKYDKGLATGIIAASGTLGQIIPPSIVLIILGDVLSNSYLEARRSVGDWSAIPMSIGDVFTGALLPGLILVAGYMIYTFLVAILRPQMAPPAALEGELPKLSAILLVLLPPLILIISVLGSIIYGVATPTEAASIGAVGALLLAGQKLSNLSSSPQIGAAVGTLLVVFAATLFDLRLFHDAMTATDRFGIGLAIVGLSLMAWGLLSSLHRCLRSLDPITKAPVLAQAVRTTTKMTAMIFSILIGSQVFNLVFRGLGGDQTIYRFFDGLSGGPWVALAAVMLVMFLLGFFLDFLEIVFVVTPIMAPVLFAFNDPSGQALFNPVWIAVLMGLNLQTSFLTPPFGISLFYLRGVAPPDVKTIDIYKGIIPFVAIQILVLAAVAYWPQIATVLSTRPGP